MSFERLGNPVERVLADVLALTYRRRLESAERASRRALERLTANPTSDAALKGYVIACKVHDEAIINYRTACDAVRSVKTATDQPERT